MSTLGKTQFQDVSRQHIEQVIKSLNKFEEYCSCITGLIINSATGEIPSIKEIIGNLKETYVTNQQRITHETISKGVSAADSSPPIELF